MALSTENVQFRARCLLARWALAIQEYDFTIDYQNGGQNNNADALPRMPQPEGDKVNALQTSTTSEGEHSAATTCSPCTPTDLQQQQQQHDDLLLCQLHEELSKGGGEHHLYRVVLGSSHRYAAIAKFCPSSQSKMV